MNLREIDAIERDDVTREDLEDALNLREIDAIERDM